MKNRNRVSVLGQKAARAFVAADAAWTAVAAAERKLGSARKAAELADAKAQATYTAEGRVGTPIIGMKSSSPVVLCAGHPVTT